MNTLNISKKKEYGWLIHWIFLFLKAAKKDMIMDGAIQPFTY